MNNSLDFTALSHIDRVFGTAPRPVIFTVADGDQECMEYERLFQSHTPDNLPLRHFLAIVSPLSELLAPGLKYFMPVLARFALNFPDDYGDWSGSGLINRLSRVDFYNSCNNEERSAIHEFLSFLYENKYQEIENLYLTQEILSVIEIWSK